MRLTKKDITNIYENKTFMLPRITSKKLTIQILNEMIEYKTIEEELGIDLVTLIKANNDGAYYKEDLRHYIAHVDLKHKCVRLVKHYEAEDDFDCQYVMFKDYGKTWCLTKEELL